MLRVIVPGEFASGLNCPDDIFVRRGIFPWRWNQVSWLYLKKDKKQIEKHVFLTEIKEQH